MRQWNGLVLGSCLLLSSAPQLLDAFSLGMTLGRREMVNSGVAAGAALPFVKNLGTEAAMDKNGKAPLITIFDHRGCTRPPKEYNGQKANGPEDEMMVKVYSSIGYLSPTL
mmetsp:Transcript_3437/g.5483  ORF Transcript_3437/g.5483 Transcript_3437/m.5483 type:complete len:111 (-) Transcript_3437:1966-2298(-)